MKNNYFMASVAWSLVTLVAAAGMAGCSDDRANNTDQSVKDGPSVSLPTAVAALNLTLNTRYPSRSFYTGRVEASRSSDLGFELGGMLRSVGFDEGDRVTAGDVLAQLDTDRLEAQLLEVRAGVAQAEAQAALAQSTLERMVDAREFDGVSLQQFDEASNAADTSKASVLAAQSRLTRVEVDVAKAKLVAPYDAVVLKRHYDEGQVLGPGQAVLSIQETTQLQIRVGVVGDSVSQLEAGERYTLIINDQPVVATLRSVLPVRDAVTRTVDAIFTLSTKKANGASKKAADSVQAGDLAQLELRREVNVAGYWVPLTALAEGERGLWNAYVLVRQTQSDKNSSLIIQSRAVEVLYQDGTRAYINGALKPDEQIVPTGLNRIVPGQQVTLRPEGP